MGDGEFQKVKANIAIQDVPITEDEENTAECLFYEIVSEVKKKFFPDMPLLRMAYTYAFEMHKNQRRYNGQPYIMHSLEVAKILTDVGFDSSLIAAAILHAVINKCGVSTTELEHKFGDTIADTVFAVSRVEEPFEDEEIETKDIENLTDVRFLQETTKNNNRRAFYIKLADTIHNIRTIDVMSEEVQLKKIKHARNILIPVAKKMQVFKLVDILESLCLQVENPTVYQEIQTGYQRLLYENRDTLEGKLGIKQFMRNIFLADKRSFPNYIEDLIFVERMEDSIFRHLTSKIDNMNHLSAFITKKNVPLYDICLVVSDAYEGQASDLFMKYYPQLYESRFRFTIVGFDKTAGTDAIYYKVVDRYGNRYRLFVQKESEYLLYSHGLLPYDMENKEKANAYINEAEPDEPVHNRIQVYKQDGSLMLIDEGATVLDFAFALHRDIGICARYAYLNGKKVRVPLDTRLKPGDRVHVISDHFKDAEENNIPHANVRWFEYVHTREATKALSRWMEKNMERAMPKITVHDSARIYSYEIDKGATALDLAFLLDKNKALYVDTAFIGNRSIEIPLEQILKNGNIISFTYKETCEPDFNWLNIVKTKHAREALINYFKTIYQN